MRGNWPFSFRDLLALQAAYDTLTAAGNATAAADGTWDEDLDLAHHRIGLVLAHATAARFRFQQQYAGRSGVTVAWLRSRGRYAEPCTCSEPGCPGWAMGHQLEDAALGRHPETAEWKPGWWRVAAPDGSVWAESGNEEDARAAVRPGDTLYRQWRRVQAEWRPDPGRVST